MLRLCEASDYLKGNWFSQNLEQTIRRSWQRYIPPMRLWQLRMVLLLCDLMQALAAASSCGGDTAGIQIGTFVPATYAPTPSCSGGTVADLENSLLQGIL